MTCYVWPWQVVGLIAQTINSSVIKKKKLVHTNDTHYVKAWTYDKYKSKILIGKQTKTKKKLAVW